MRKIISRILIAAGIILIGLALYQKISTSYYQNKLVKEYDKYISQLKETESNTVTNNDNNDEIDNTEELPQTPEGTGNNPLESIEENLSSVLSVETTFSLEEFLKDKEISGLIEIPKIKVNAAILEGSDDRALKYTVGHYPGYGQAGQAGNYVLLGHRNYVYGHFFRNIDKLQEGDHVIIKKDAETYTYVVTESFVVAPKDVWVLKETEEPTITLITCTPIGTYTDRLIVKGVLQSP